MTQTHYSLKKRLILYTSLFSILMGCMLVISAYRIALEETNEILDAQMKNLAERVSKFNPEKVQSQFDPNRKYHEEDLFVDVWPYAEKTHQQHNFNLLVNPVKNAGFYPQHTHHGLWQTYVLPTPDMQVQVSQQNSVRQNLALELAINMLLPYLMIMPFAIWGLSYIIRKSFMPIEKFKTELVARQPNELSPIACDHYPDEIIPSIQEINYLFEKISAAQQEQRQFIADAAHELRTPITALNLQTEILMREIPDHPSLLRLNQGLARMQHLVNQLLHLAKQDAAVVNEAHQSLFFIHHVAVNCIEHLIDLALEKEIDLGMERLEHIQIFGEESTLYSIIYNLIDNAIKYTPSRGTINISCFLENQNAVVNIEDSGPGIAPELYPHLVKRFYRVYQHLETGSGLGLSIVHKAIQRLDGEVEFSQSALLGGLKVSISLPLTLNLNPDA